MWLETGTGDANLIHFQCLAYQPCLLCYYLHQLLFGNRETTNGTAIDASIIGENKKTIKQL